MFQPASFNSMNHENVFNRIRQTLIGFNTVTLAVRGEWHRNGLFLIFLSVVLEDRPSRIHSKVHAFLVDRPTWRLLEPEPFLAVATTATSLIITFSTILVKYRHRNRIHTTTTTCNRFKNPFKNVNFIIVFLTLTYTLLQTFFFDIKRFPLLLFPRFSLGLMVTPMLCLFLLGNQTIKKYAVKRIFSFLPCRLERWHSQGNVIQSQNNTRTTDSQNSQRIVHEHIQMEPMEIQTNVGNERRSKWEHALLTGRNITIHVTENKEEQSTSLDNMNIENIE